MTDNKTPSRRTGLQRRLRFFREGVSNTVELLREGRLSAPYQAEYTIEHSEPVFKLRHYPPQGDTPNNQLKCPIVLVPPLMIASEIYDLSPELSAVAFLAAQGADVWLVDFGDPAAIEGGLKRSLEDHILAVDHAINYVCQRSQQDVHLAGYSQGGMFAYQAAAYRRSAGLKSIITFGSPVDVHRNAPGNLHESITEQLLDSTGDTADALIKALGGVPGALSSSSFKLLSAGKEMKSMLDFFSVIGNRDAAEKRERQRRFLGGEGFVAWPGPAVREFIQEMLVNNRLIKGGLVINEKPVTLADIHCPILYFVGSQDTFGRPPSVRAINTAAIHAKVQEVEINAGHFGLVVGSKSLKQTWPTVISWMAWQEQAGPQPNFEMGQTTRQATPETVAVPDNQTAQLYDIASNVLDKVIEQASATGKNLSHSISETVDLIRWQLPRIQQIKQIRHTSTVSMSLTLAEQAAAIPNNPFLLWDDHSYSYQQAHQRVNKMAVAMTKMGITTGTTVAVFMPNHPDYLVIVAALNRIGAVAALINANVRGASLNHALNTAQTRFIICDASRQQACVDIQGSNIWAWCPPETPLLAGIQAIAPLFIAAKPTKQDEKDFNLGTANDLALLIFTSGTTGLPKAVKITNGRWVAGALAAAATAQTTNKDTIYCCLPLYHSSGQIVAIGGSLVGGARLALTAKFSVSQFWPEVRRYGATIVVYVGELCRYLLNQPAQAQEQNHPIRLFMGNGLNAGTWEALNTRFAPARILEFYASTEGNVVLSNITGKKIGSVGQPVFDGSQIKLVAFDHETDQPITNAQGHLRECLPSETGLLIAQIEQGHPLKEFTGYLSDDATQAKIIKSAFIPGDRWFNTGDLLRCDADGDYWFVDRIGDTFRWHGETISSAQVDAVVSQLPFVAACAVYGVAIPEREGRAGALAIQLKTGQKIDLQKLFNAVEQNLSPAARPRIIRVVPKLQTTDSFKTIKYRLQNQGADPQKIKKNLYYYNKQKQCYWPLTADLWPHVID